MFGSLHLLAPLLAAQAEAPGGGGDSFSSFFAPFAIVIAVLYLMVIRPAQKERKQHQSMLEALKRGDDVVTSSGILGTITDMSDPFVTIEVARNVKIRVLKSAIGKKYVEPKNADKKAEAKTAKA